MSSNTSGSSAVQLHFLCSQCKSFWECVPCLSFRTDDLGSGDKASSMPQHLLFSPHRADVLRAASLGCHFCSIIVGAVVGCTGDHGDRQFAKDDNGPIYISVASFDAKAATFLLTLFPCEQSKVTSHDQILNDYPLLLRQMQGTSATFESFPKLISISRKP